MSGVTGLQPQRPGDLIAQQGLRVEPGHGQDGLLGRGPDPGPLLGFDVPAHHRGDDLRDGGGLRVHVFRQRRIRSRVTPPSTSSAVPVVEPDRGLAR